MGLVKKRVPLGHPDFGKAFPCQCQREKIAQRRQIQLNMTSHLDAYQTLRFDNFQTQIDGLTPEQNDNLINAREMAIDYAFEPEGQWLLLRGGYGSGKTHLAAAIGNWRLEQGHTVIFMTTPDLLDHLRQAYAPNAEIEYDELFEHLKTTPLLILDDLGSESATAWANEKLFQLLNHRYVSKLSTVITTNLDLDHMDARIRSRLVDQHLTRIIALDLPDYRRGGETQSHSELFNLRLYSQMTFENFVLKRAGLTVAHTQNLGKIHAVAQSFAQSPQSWLILLGANGCGKTHLAAAIANAYHQQHGEGVIMLNTGELIEHLKETLSSNSRDTLSARFNEVRKAPLLILDYFQLDTASAWAREKLFQIFEYRYLAHLPMVITKAGSSIDDLEERFQARMRDARFSRILFIEAPAYHGGISVKSAKN
jgi:DNA replication protein DnaC